VAGRDRDQAPSEALVARVFDRLASPEGLTRRRRPSPAKISWSRSARA
jgi:hypothetical protein